MHITVTETMFIDYLLSDKNANWSFEAAKAMFKFYDDLEESVESLEFDLASIREDWTEYKSFKEVEDLTYDYASSLPYTSIYLENGHVLLCQ